MSEITAWISFRLAVEEVERTLGVNWGLAQKTLLKACASGKVPSKPSDHGPDIGADEFRDWLGALSRSELASPQAQLEALTGQSRLAWEAIKGCWPSRLPGHVRGKEMHRRGSEWITERYGKNTNIPGVTTFVRVAKLVRSAQTIRTIAR